MDSDKAELLETVLAGAKAEADARAETKRASFILFIYLVSEREEGAMCEGAVVGKEQRTRLRSSAERHHRSSDESVLAIELP